MLQHIRQIVSNTIVNYPGYRTKRKLVVFESDDWGSIRMPSKATFKALQDYGLPVEKSPYCRYDSLESNQDMEQLFDVLTSFKDSYGNHPIITANTVVANPDFAAIRQSNYEKYYYEPFPETLKNYPDSDQVFEYYGQGLSHNIFFPQFHGREHVNVALWLQLLKDNKVFQFAFQHRMWGLSNDLFPNQKSIQATFDSEDDSKMQEAIVSGLTLFEALFGYKSASFIANNFVWSTALEPVLADCGVVHLQGMKYQKLPKVKNEPSTLIRHHLGEKNQYGQIYGVRNCSFEPSIDGTGHGKTIREIQNAFFWNKPAIISTHRINFIGSLNDKNQKRNGDEFKKLIQNILKKWPEAEFLNTSQLDSIIRNG